MKALIPDIYDEEIKKYQTPHKIIEVGDKRIIVTVTKQIWAGVKLYNKEHVDISENKRGDIFIVAYKKSRELLVSTILQEKEVGEDFKRDMIKTGYITEEEYDRYIGTENREGLPVISLTNA